MQYTFDQFGNPNKKKPENFNSAATSLEGANKSPFAGTGVGAFDPSGNSKGSRFDLGNPSMGKGNDFINKNKKQDFLGTHGNQFNTANYKPMTNLSGGSVDTSSITKEPVKKGNFISNASDADKQAASGIVNAGAAAARGATVDQPLGQGEEDYSAGKDIAVTAASSLVPAVLTGIAAGGSTLGVVGAAAGAVIGLVVGGISVSKKKKQAAANKKRNTGIRETNKNNRNRQRIAQEQTDAQGSAARLAGERREQRKYESSYGGMYQTGGVIGYSDYLEGLKKKGL